MTVQDKVSGEVFSAQVRRDGLLALRELRRYSTGFASAKGAVFVMPVPEANTNLILRRASYYERQQLQRAGYNLSVQYVPKGKFHTVGFTNPEPMPDLLGAVKAFLAAQDKGDAKDYIAARDKLRHVIADMEKRK